MTRDQWRCEIDEWGFYYKPGDRVYVSYRAGAKVKTVEEPILSIDEKGVLLRNFGRRISYRVVVEMFKPDLNEVPGGSIFIKGTLAYDM